MIKTGFSTFSVAIDELVKSNLPSIYSNYSTFPFIEVLLVLLDFVSINHVVTSEMFCCSFTLDTSLKKEDVKAKIGVLKRGIFDSDITNAKFEQYINKLSSKNRNFYAGLLQEIYAFYYYKQKNSCTTSFIFAYRIFENISFAFPLLYASSTADFKETFNKVKSLFVSDKSIGELGFFSTFVSTMFKDGTTLSTTIDIDIPYQYPNDCRIQLYDFIADFMKTECKVEINASSIKPDKIIISFIDYATLVIILRNRFVHNKNGGWERNIQINQFVDADILFSLIIEKFPYWLNLLLVEIVKSEFIRIS